MSLLKAFRYIEDTTLQEALHFALHEPDMFDAALWDFEVNKMPELEKQAAEREAEEERSARKAGESIEDARERILAGRRKFKEEHGLL